MRSALITAFLCLSVCVFAQEGGPAITVELHDDDTEQVTLMNTGPVSPQVEAAAILSAGCLSGSGSGGLRPVGWRWTCRHPVERTRSLFAPAISASWDFSPLANALAPAGVTFLTTCIYHPDWPVSEISVSLPKQSLSKMFAYCGAWPVPATGPLRMTAKAGYTAGTAEKLALAAMAYLLVFALLGRLARRDGSPDRHSLMALWWVSCFVWIAIVLALDGLRMLALTFGSAGNSRWLWTGLVAAIPPAALAGLLSIGQEPRIIKRLRQNAVAAAGLSIFVTAILCGTAQSDPLNLLGYFVAAPLVFVSARWGGSRSRVVPVESGELRTSFETLAAKAGVRPPKLALWDALADSNPGAAALIGGPGMILLSAALLKLWSKDEVNAILAHELAHFRQRRRVALFLYVSVILILLACGVLLNQSAQVWLVLPFFLTMLLLAAWKRRMEFASDAFSASLTGHPEAISAVLVRLAALNRSPVRGGVFQELFLSHPWTEKRVRRLGGSLEITEPSVSEPKYASDSSLAGILAANTSSSRPVAQFTQELTKFVSFLMARIWISGLLAGVLAWILAASLPTGAGIFVAAVAIGFWIIATQSSQRFARTFRAVRAATQTIRGSNWPEALLCGLSPGKGRVLFHTGQDWDFGLVRISDDALCYSGDREAFALPRTAISRIEQRPGVPIRWKRTSVVCVYLRSMPREAFTLRVVPEQGESARARQQQALFDALRRWHEGAIPQPGSSETTPGCGLPMLDSSLWPKESGKRAKLLSVANFVRYAFAAAVPPLAIASILWGWSSGPQVILPPLVALGLHSLFLVPPMFVQVEIASPAPMAAAQTVPQPQSMR
jgi:Zn-dependent protease with chaperone function